MTQIVPAVRLENIPSIYATSPSAKVSEKYGFIPTSVIVHALERSGFVPVKASAARSSLERAALAKHLIRFRHQDHMNTQVGDWLPEVVLVNSHDGSSSDQIMAGVYRLVCCNGLVVGNSFAEARVRHTKNAPDEIVDASFRVIESLPGIAEGIESMRAITLEAGEHTMTQLETLLARVDSLKAEWDAARPIPAPLLEQLRTDWEVLLTYHSNAIEGSTLTLGETKAILLDGITIAGKPLREHLEAINHREAMRLMTRLAQSGTLLLETELLELQRTILTRIQSEDAGVYRTVRVRVAGSMRVFPNPVKVPELMGVFVEDVNVMQSHPVVIAARAHYGLVAIHPFADGVCKTDGRAGMACVVSVSTASRAQRTSSASLRPSSRALRLSAASW
jgi:Domain of unknown function (DUF932)/Fic/DOC family